VKSNGDRVLELYGRMNRPRWYFLLANRRLVGSVFGTRARAVWDPIWRQYEVTIPGEEISTVLYVDQIVKGMAL